MDSGIIILGDLRKDIEYIEYYSEIEEQQLKSIYNSFNELSKYYISQNQSMFNEKQIVLNHDINLIEDKRILYVKILRNTIITYITMAKKAANEFDKDVYKL